MSKKPTTLSRRTFLKGVGVSLALPTLEAMLPRRASAAGQTLPLCLVNMIVPNGVSDVYGYAAPQMSPIGLAAFSAMIPHTDYTTLTGIKNYEDDETHTQYAPGGHSPRIMTYFNGQTPEGPLTNGRVKTVYRTFEQFIGDALPGSKFKTLSAHLGQNGGVGDAGPSVDSGRYADNPLWADPSPNTSLAERSIPVAPWYLEPQRLFQDMFGTNPTAAGAMPDPAAQAAAAERKRRGLSLLDTLKSARARLDRSIGNRDRRILDEYYASLRDLEVRVQSWDATSQMIPAGCDPLARPASGSAAYPPSKLYAPASASQLDPTNYVERSDLFMDLIVKALQCDLVHVFNLAMGSDATALGSAVVPGLTKDDWHGISHDGYNTPDYNLVTKWMHERFAMLVKRLAATVEPDGTRLLDRTVTMLHYPLCEGHTHWNNFNSVILAGGTAAGFKMGRDLNLGGSPSHSCLWLTVMKQLMQGAAPGQFGTRGTSVISDLTA
jgi:hypothetical protein